MATVLGLLCFLNACALSEDIVELEYTSTTQPQSLGIDGKPFSLIVDDVRVEYAGTIGNKINGYGAEMAAIRPTVPVRAVVFQAIEKELAARNIPVSLEAASKIVIEITALHNNFQSGGWTGTARGITTLTTLVRNTNDDVLYNNTVSAVHVEEEVMVASGSNAARAVQGAMAKAIKAMFDDPAFIEALVSA
ncbi:MAG: YajG family lipoprotein [Alphaproteobacteria bacterium]